MARFALGMVMGMVACGLPSEGVPEASVWDAPTSSLPLEVPAPLQSVPVTFAGDLSLAPVVRGGTMRVDVVGMPPGARVWLLVSRAIGAGACPPQVAPACLDVGAPFFVLADAVASGTGEVRFEGAVPATLPWTRLEAQAVAFTGGGATLSNARWADVVDAAPACEDRDGLHSQATPLLVQLGYGAWDGDDAFFQPNPYSGERVIADATTYAALQQAVSQPLPSVDFSQHAVAVAWLRWQGCGSYMSNAAVSFRTDGGMQFDVDRSTDDDPCQSCVTCDALGDDLNLYQLPAPGLIPACSRWLLEACEETDVQDTCF